MPELPDLQVFSRNLTELFGGKRLKKVEIPYTKKLKTPAKKFKSALEGKILKEVSRDGKELFFKFSDGSILGLHLMLRGELYEFKKKHDRKFPILELHFADGHGLVMTDYQGQANPRLNPIEGEGADALSEDVNFKFLKDKFQKSKAAVKNILLDQKFIRGIGNAYVDEILWETRLSPFSAANKIPDAQIKTLAKSIKKVLRDAEKTILKTNPDIISGEVRDFLKIHNHKKTHSPTGGKIIVDKSGSRKTYYTEEQKLFE